MDSNRSIFAERYDRRTFSAIKDDIGGLRDDGNGTFKSFRNC